MQPSMKCCYFDYNSAVMHWMLLSNVLRCCPGWYMRFESSNLIYVLACCLKATAALLSSSFEPHNKHSSQKASSPSIPPAHQPQYHFAHRSSITKGKKGMKPGQQHSNSFGCTRTWVAGLKVYLVSTPCRKLALIMRLAFKNITVTIQPSRQGSHFDSWLPRQTLVLQFVLL